MQTAYCSEHGRLEPIAGVRDVQDGHEPGSYVVAVTLRCGERSNIIMSHRNLARLRPQLEA